MCWAWRGAEPVRATARSGRRSALNRKRRSISLEMIRVQAKMLLVIVRTADKRGAGDDNADADAGAAHER